MAKLRKGSKVRRSKKGGARAELSDEWTEHIDRPSQRPYYHNSVTRETTWGDPRDPAWGAAADRRRNLLEELARAGIQQGNDPEPKPAEGGKTRKSKKKTHKKTKRKMNGFMKMMLDAKKHNKPSFVYKGKKYKQGKIQDKLDLQ